MKTSPKAAVLLHLRDQVHSAVGKAFDLHGAILGFIPGTGITPKCRAINNPWRQPGIMTPKQSKQRKQKIK